MINCIIEFYNIEGNNIINAAIPDCPFLNDSDDARNTPDEPDHDLLIDAGTAASKLRSETGVKVDVVE